MDIAAKYENIYLAFLYAMTYIDIMILDSLRRNLMKTFPNFLLTYKNPKLVLHLSEDFFVWSVKSPMEKTVKIKLFD